MHTCHNTVLSWRVPSTLLAPALTKLTYNGSYPTAPSAPSEQLQVLLTRLGGAPALQQLELFIAPQCVVPASFFEYLPDHLETISTVCTIYDRGDFQAERCLTCQASAVPGAAGLASLCAVLQQIVLTQMHACSVASSCLGCMRWHHFTAW